MNHTLEDTINQPIDQVISFFRDPGNYPLWMEGLKEHQVISGKAGEKGTESKFIFDMKGRTMEMKEVVLESNLPDNYTVQYVTPGMVHKVGFSFSKINEESTKIVNYNEFRFSGFMKVTSFFMGGALKKQSQKYLNDFKTAVEKT